MMKRALLVLSTAALVAACSSGHEAATQSATPRQVTIGSTTGSAGGQVTVPITLTKEAHNIVTIAPLVFEFNAQALRFKQCVARVDGKSVDAVSPSAGRVSFVMAGGMDIIPEGPIVDCTFDVNANAAHGASPVKFVLAGMADADLNDIAASGTDGSVTVR